MLEMTSMRLLTLAVLVLTVTPVVYAQNNPSNAVPDQNLVSLKKQVRSMTKQLIGANMQLTDAEAQKFWAVYEQYAAENSKLYDARYAILKEYADNIATFTDSQAQSLAKRGNDVDVAVIQLRQAYFPIFEKIIAGKKTARFFQLDRRLSLLFELQLASETPLIQP